MIYILSTHSGTGVYTEHNLAILSMLSVISDNYKVKNNLNKIGLHAYLENSNIVVQEYTFDFKINVIRDGNDSIVSINDPLYKYSYDKLIK